jgi:hypothetical protein
MAPNDHLADQLRAAYDVYLSMHRRLAQNVIEALGHSEADQQSALLCPPCFYRISNEAKLFPSLLCAMDSNNSLKLIDSSYRAGTT